MTEWKEIRLQSDIYELLDIYSGFHDSCIVSVNYKSGTYVNEKNAMRFGNAADYELRIVFHSQWNPKIMELCFTGVRQIHLTGWRENYYDIIFDVQLSFYDGVLFGSPNRVIVWANDYDFDRNKMDTISQDSSDTYIVADSLKWRIGDENESEC